MTEAVRGSGPLGGIVHAPWTLAQVENLNGYQKSLAGHPYTCRLGTHDGTRPSLIATLEGWECPGTCGGEPCDYTQDWAHGYMADGTWREDDRVVRDMLSGS